MAFLLMLTQNLTARSRILTFLREPWSGQWIGEPGFLTVAQIADGADVKTAHARRVLAKLAAKGEVRLGTSKPKTFAALE